MSDRLVLKTSREKTPTKNVATGSRVVGESYAASLAKIKRERERCDIDRVCVDRRYDGAGAGCCTAADAEFAGRSVLVGCRRDVIITIRLTRKAPDRQMSYTSFSLGVRVIRIDQYGRYIDEN